MSRVSEWGLVCISLVVSSSCLPPPCRFVFVMRSIVPIKRDVNEPPPQARESKYATLVPEDELLPHAELGREDRYKVLEQDLHQTRIKIQRALIEQDAILKTMKEDKLLHRPNPVEQSASSS